VVLYGGRVVGVWEVKDGKVAMNSFQNIPAKPLRTESPGSGLCCRESRRAGYSGDQACVLGRQSRD
jgi:hypothetical protein